MKNQIRLVAIEKLIGNPDSPNRMSKGKFNKLVRNIERTGLYEPLIVRLLKSDRGRACPERSRREARDTEAYEIINGHQRWQALRKLGFERVDVIVWDVDDVQADVFLATLNRLGGSDVLDKKLSLLKRLSEKLEAACLAKLLPQSAGQIERLTDMARSDRGLEARDTKDDVDMQCVAFFLDEKQKKLIERAMSLAGGNQKTKAARNAAALTQMAERFLAEKLNIKNQISKLRSPGEPERLP